MHEVISFHWGDVDWGTLAIPVIMIVIGVLWVITSLKRED